jgi:LEA14-like dessication related protein
MHNLRAHRGDLSVPRIFAACLLVLLLSACAGQLRPSIEPPEVRLAGLGFGEPGLFEQAIKLDLRVSNPNDFAIGVQGMTFDLQVNDIAFAQGRTSEGFELPALGDAVVPVTLFVPTMDLLERAVQLGVEQRLNYRLSGEADMDSLFVGRVPFQYQGKLALPRIPGLGASGP